jgi:hypothetical protein
MWALVINHNQALSIELHSTFTSKTLRYEPESKQIPSCPTRLGRSVRRVVPTHKKTGSVAPIPVTVLRCRSIAGEATPN